MTRPFGERPTTETDLRTPGAQTNAELPAWTSSDTLQPDTSRPAVTPNAASRGFGDYELVGEIARGGMGVVYKARQQSLQRTVALKMILEGQLASGESVQRFYQEARAAAGLDHPNIVPIYEVGQYDGRHYFTMALVEGSSLAAAVRQGGLPSVAEAAALALGVAEAVAYAHAQGIIHRDLKPENVLLDRHGRPRVTDFGLAKSFTTDSGLTASGEVLGTPAYMAPEQAMGNTSLIGPPADVYALGGILYFLLTGKPPFTGNSVMDVLYRVVHTPPAPPRQVNPDVPSELEALCLKCLAKAPGDRWATAMEVATALRPWAITALSTGSSTWPSLPSSPQSGAGAPHARGPDAGGSRTELLPARSHGGRGVLAVLVVALLAAGGYLARGWWAKPPGDPAPAANERAEERQKVAAATVVPEVTHHDFDLKVELVGASREEGGDFRLENGQRVEFRIKTERDAYVGVWNIAPDGKILQVFPNEYEPDSLVRAGSPRMVPGATGDEAYLLRATGTGGLEHVWVVASTRKWDLPRGESEGPYVIFRNPPRRRDFLKVPVSRGLVAEVLLDYRVVPRK